MSEPNEILSERELEILRLVATGAANKEIARQLLISPNTVKVHLRNIFSKIDVTSRTEATLYAIQIGLIHPSGQPATVVEPDALAQDDLALPEKEELASAESPADQPESLQPTAGTTTGPTPGRRPRLQLRQLLWAALILPGLAAGILWLSRLAPASVLSAQSRTVQPAALQATPSARWANKESLPTGRKAMGAVEYNNSFYLVGGETSAGIDGSLLRYTPVKDEWQLLAAKPVAVSEVQAALVGERIYVPGGKLASGGDSDVFEVYDPRQNTWSELARLPVPISAYALVAYEGRLFLFGGKSGSQYLDSVYEYLPDSDRWESRTPMKNKLAYAGAAVVGNRIFIIGGYDGKNAQSGTVAYHPARDKDGENPWEAFAALPDGRYGFAVCTLSNMIYLAGGLGDHQISAPQQTLQYLPQTDQWTMYDSPTKPLGSFGIMLPLEGFLHFLGGTDGQKLLTLHQSYQALYFNVIPLIQNDN